MTTYAATLDHSDWVHSRVFLSDTEEGAEAKATAFLLAQTAEFREGSDERYDDEEWLEVCLSEDWALSTGVVVE